MQRLAEALPRHYKLDAPYRESEDGLVADYAGKTTYPGLVGYTTLMEAPEKQIINLTMQAAEAFAMNIAAGRPRFLCTSREASLDWFAQKMSRTLDRYASRINLEETLQDCARNSYFSTGICKVFQANSPGVWLESDYRADPGRPFCQSIRLNRFVRDCNAETPEEATFMGDMYAINLDRAMRSTRFGQSAKQQLKQVGKNWRRKRGTFESQEYAPYVEDVLYLCDVYVRSRQAVFTFIVDEECVVLSDGPVQRVRWNGAECGPYHFLNMGPVPGFFYASSPGQNGKLLQQLVNTCYRKLEDQTRREKEIGTAANDDDVKKAAEVSDGEFVTFQNPELVRSLRMGGPDQQTFAFFLNALEQHSRANGNLANKLGLAPSADTARQEAMIASNVSRLEAFYQGRFVSFVRSVARSLATLIWHDSYLEVPGTIEIPGTPFRTDDSWLPAGEMGAREGTPEVYDIDIDPYSLGYRSPAERAGFIAQEVMKWLPADPWLAQKGQSIDAAEYFNIMSELGNAPELRRVFRTNQPPVQPSPTGEMQSVKAGGPKEYVHRSAGSLRQNPNAEAAQMMAAGEADNRN